MARPGERSQSFMELSDCLTLQGIRALRCRDGGRQVLTHYGPLVDGLLLQVRCSLRSH